MKIVVLAGGLSTERDVSLASGAGICRTLRERGHEAFLLDVYLGFPYDTDKLGEVFTLPGAGLEIADSGSYSFNKTTAIITICSVVLSLICVFIFVYFYNGTFSLYDI